MTDYNREDLQDTIDILKNGDFPNYISADLVNRTIDDCNRDLTKSEEYIFNTTCSYMTEVVGNIHEELDPELSEMEQQYLSELQSFDERLGV